ncbi:hypothetical protein CR161_09355 [Prosthecochloris sp. ZM]|uniref:DUF3124 domain-containing protein n=1 Tax=Prosthecochloris sp. ZM TaxID=2283143 RepID=UPI000DF75FBD|nr:DUF3124 domain-containing protein [Prosthecochloris sp. ZM]RDD30889.1 hypothetical protein CR161_09355 [Prosthecochloris sp. ZM]
MSKKLLLLQLFAVFCLCIMPLHSVCAQEKSGGLSKGEVLYAPAYSHIYSINGDRLFQLTVTLSIRNIDMKHGITIVAVDYYDSQGKLLKHYIQQEVELDPLKSLRFVVPQLDKTGGSGASFIVKWQADRFVNSPIVESIMIGTQSQQGVSFVSRAKEIY